MVAPADGTVEHFSVGYDIDLLQCLAGFPEGAEPNFDSMIAAFLAENKDLPVPQQYVCGTVALRLKDGRRIYLSGLRGNVSFERGMTVCRGDVLGTVGYGYRSIQEPHIYLASSSSVRGADLMKLFGL